MPTFNLPEYLYLDSLNQELAVATSILTEDFSPDEMAWFRRPVGAE